MSKHRIYVIHWNKFYQTLVPLNTRTRRSKRWRRTLRAARRGDMIKAFQHLQSRERESDE